MIVSYDASAQKSKTINSKPIFKGLRREQRAQQGSQREDKRQPKGRKSTKSSRKGRQQAAKRTEIDQKQPKRKTKAAKRTEVQNHKFQNQYLRDCGGSSGPNKAAKEKTKGSQKDGNRQKAAEKEDKRQPKGQKSKTINFKTNI